MAPLVGIAKLAASGALLEAKRKVTYTELPTRKILAKCDSPRMPFGWMINPYRGCEFGCKYCYARYTHEFMELRDPDDFELKIFAKDFSTASIRDELRRLGLGEKIAIGTATDPYQPAERRYGLTRKIWDAFAQTSGFEIGLITKSDLILRDLELLNEVSRRHRLTLVLTITTLDTDLARLMEPLAPRPDLRLAAVRELAAAGLRVSVNCCPILPLLNDSEASLNAVAEAAKQAGATRLAGNVVYLKPSAYQVFLPFLEQNFPQLAGRYRERFAQHAYLRGSYPEMIRQRLDQIRERHGFMGAVPQPQPELWPSHLQLPLFAP